MNIIICSSRPEWNTLKNVEIFLCLLLEKNSILDSLLLFDVRIFATTDDEDFKNVLGGPSVASVNRNVVRKGLLRFYEALSR